tara:strand:- start:325 stop:525 length:201 start_codon:yes stop_codon:yes gene_type:complete
MSKIKREPYEDRKVMVSASDLATLVAYRWDAMKVLEEQGFDVLAKDLKSAGSRCSDRLYKSGFWTE